MNNKKRKVAKGIAKVINKIHGIDNPAPLVEGVDYTTGTGEEIKKSDNTPVKKKEPEKPNEHLIWVLLSEGKFEEALKLVGNNLSLLSPDQREIIDEWRKIEQEKRRLEIQQELRKKYGITEEDAQRANLARAQRAQLEQMGKNFASGSGPIVSNILSGVAKPNPARQQAKTGQSLFDAVNTTSSNQKQEQVEVSPKKDPERTKITAGSSQHIRIGDSESDILAKMFMFMQKNQKWHDMKEKQDKKYRKLLDKQKDRFLDETVEALSGKKTSTIKKLARVARKSGFLKTAAKVAIGVGGLLVAKDALANIDWGKKFEDAFKDLIPDLPESEFTKKYDEDEKGARKSIEDYLGRGISDKEMDELVRATSAEAGAKSNKTEQSMIMATILNRARDSGKTITEILKEPKQFQAVTGTKFKPGPSEQYTKGPSEERRADILSGAATILPQVSKKQKRFTAESEAAYGPGTDIGYREELKKTGGDVIGGTRFETKAPSTIGITLSKITGVTSGFGMRGGEEHEGLDIRGKIGDAVITTGDGKILRAGWENPEKHNKGYGQFIEIQHKDGTITRYAHLSKIDVNAGDMVQSGQKIGEVGSTGHSTGPHLHYEVRKNGQAIDPKESGAFNLNPVVPDYKLSSADSMYRETQNMKKAKDIPSVSILNNDTNIFNGGIKKLVQNNTSDYSDLSSAITKQFYNILN